MMGPKEKIERKLGEHLHLKGERCQGAKCVMVRRPQRPGMHGAKRVRRQQSDFAKQLREKAKFKVTYGLDERNLRALYGKAAMSKGDVAVKLLELFERRLDNVIFRLGIAPARGVARMMVVQGHIVVNGKRVHSPGFQVKTGDVVGIREQSRTKGLFKELPTFLKKVEVPAWLSVDAEKVEGTMLSAPRDVESLFEINLLVESFSK